MQVRQSLASVGTDDPKLDEVTHPFALVLTQECDLEQDFAARAHGQGKLDNVLLCPAVVTTQLKTIASASSHQWKLVTSNRELRYQCLEAIPSEQDGRSEGIASLGCDFKRYFTIPTDELYKRVSSDGFGRRARLVTPYAEHLLLRFCAFQARLPLPEPHNVI